MNYLILPFVESITLRCENAPHARSICYTVSVDCLHINSIKQEVKTEMLKNLEP